MWVALPTSKIACFVIKMAMFLQPKIVDLLNYKTMLPLKISIKHLNLKYI